MNTTEFVLQLKEIENQMPNFIADTAPKIVGKIAVSHFKNNFHEQGFTNKGVQKWTDVQRRTHPTRPDRAQASRKILTGETGDLGRSIQARAEKGQVVIFSDKEYAKAHNEGTEHAGRNRSVRIPKRQFIGESEELREKISAELEKFIKKYMQL